MKRANQLLDYMYYNSDTVIRFYASDMILNVHSDAAYLSAGKGRSSAGGYFFSLATCHKQIFQFNSTVTFTSHVPFSN